MAGNERTDRQTDKQTETDSCYVLERTLLTLIYDPAAEYKVLACLANVVALTIGKLL